jgi:hypothetical protein
VSATPAAELARLKATYGARWRIDRQEGSQETGSGPGSTYPRFTARRRDGTHVLRAKSIGDLERQIMAAEGSGSNA